MLANTNPDLFIALPAIDATGNLTFTPAPNVEGSAQITIALRDDGGTASGGMNTSPPQTFTIHVTKPHRWHNAAIAFDVNDDRQVAPNDALEVINYLNSFGARTVSEAVLLGPPYYDVSGDGFVAPNDALAVINAINAGLDGEGESISAVVIDLAAVPNDPQAQTSKRDEWGDLVALLAVDTAQQISRSRNLRR
jgi:hypothetical protein